MNTTVGHYNVTDKIIKDGYKWVDENRLINPNPMKFDYNELLLIKETLYTFVIKNYPDLPENILKNIKEITIEEIKKSLIFLQDISIALMKMSICLR